MPAVVGEDGSLHLRFNVVGIYTQLPGEKRDYAIGLRSIGYARAENTLARQELIETMTLQDLSA